METQEKSEVTQTTTAVSKDGTAIAYEKTGQGPAIILVNGALSDRKTYDQTGWTSMLAKNFTVIIYDRRGRGESTDTKPYDAEREIEDIKALIDIAGGSAYLFGSSSGAALSLLAAEKLGPEKVTKLALYEPPYGSNVKKEFAKQKIKVNELVDDGKPADAIAFFMESLGTPPDQLEGMKKSPQWDGMVSMGHTLVYDFEVLRDGEVPKDVAKNITIPTLVMNGEKSFDFMAATADTVAEAIPGAQRKTIKGQTHNPSPESVVPVLVEFFGK
ncbi:alpha/beta fold hydrolase [Emticicia sp. C21]|uniref:alpha/beta fold hydrolase n=1 Tax=Emticicia sp. C21 TaxID=2302915 RepID=UPI00131449EF|nr:alpha/beta hydrolase [Emticicia sp. C21]